MKDNAFLGYPGLEVERRGIPSSSPEENLFPLFTFLDEEIRLSMCECLLSMCEALGPILSVDYFRIKPAFDLSLPSAKKMIGMYHCAQIMLPFLKMRLIKLESACVDKHLPQCQYRPARL